MKGFINAVALIILGAWLMITSQDFIEHLKYKKPPVEILTAKFQEKESVPGDIVHLTSTIRRNYECVGFVIQTWRSGSLWVDGGAAYSIAHPEQVTDSVVTMTREKKVPHDIPKTGMWCYDPLIIYSCEDNGNVSKTVALESKPCLNVVVGSENTIKE